MTASDYIRWFGDLGAGDVASVGGKTASLGELHSVLSQDGVRVPEGFAITAQAYRDALAAAGAWTPLHQLLDGLDKSDVDLLAERAAAARKIVYAATGGEEIRRQIMTAYLDLNKKCGEGLSVAVRSSATAEDLPTASFAGQHDSYLNVGGRRPWSRLAGGVSPRSSPRGPSAIAWTMGSTTSRWLCRWRL
jgi:pyruvate,water dikinase